MTGSIGCVHFLWQSSPRILMMPSILPEAISYLGQLCFCQLYLWYFWHQRLKAKQMKICGITFWKKQVALSEIRLQELKKQEKKNFEHSSIGAIKNKKFWQINFNWFVSFKPSFQYFFVYKRYHCNSIFLSQSLISWKW